MAIRWRTQVLQQARQVSEFHGEHLCAALPRGLPRRALPREQPERTPSGAEIKLNRHFCQFQICVMFCPEPVLAITVHSMDCDKRIRERNRKLNVLNSPGHIDMANSLKIVILFHSMKAHQN